jgi:hypothetical protein
MTAPTGDVYAQNDGGSLTMSIAEMRTLGKVTVPAQIRQLTGSLDRILTALDALELSWVGEAKEEAQRFSDRWTVCATNLFGTPQHPAEGVLTRVANGILLAAANYDRSEQLVADAWHEYYNLLQSLRNGETPQGGGDRPQPVIDQF